MIRFTRTALIAGAILITMLDIIGISGLPKMPYTGIKHNNLVFREFDKDSPNASIPLTRGDKIEAVQSIKVRNINHFRHLTESADPGDAQTYTIARGDSLFDVAVKSIHQPGYRISRRIAYSLTAFTFTFLGLVVIIRRPDVLGLLFTVNCLIIAFLFTVRPVTPSHFFHLSGELIYDFMTVFFPAFFVHFFMIFPGKEIRTGSRRYFIQKLLYIPPTLIFLALFVVAMLKYSSGFERGLVLILNGVTSIYWVLYMLTSLFFFIRTYVTSDRIQKVKFRIAAVGLILGVLPLTAIMLIRFFLPDVEVPMQYSPVLFLSFISASFAYAILRHDAFDLRLVSRAVLIIVIVAAVLAAVLFILGSAMGDKYTGYLQARYYLIGFLAVIIVLAIFVPARSSVLGLIDRIFNTNRKVFRERVIEFSRRIQSYGSMDQIVGFVTSTLKELFGAEYVLVFLSDGVRNYALAGSCPEGTGLPLTSFPTDTGLIRLAREKNLPLMVEYYDRIWINSNLDRTSREFLSFSEASVIVPLVEQEELLGFVVLGRKLSGRPYGRVDAEILELLGERSAVAVRNNQLYRDSMEKDKLEEEVHLASEIQQRLLPSSPPRMDKAEILGGIRTSREVGGDFYDYLVLEPGMTGFAVADVSGKGIPASLLMTTLQAGFRAEATAKKSPADVLESLNRLLYDRSDIKKFATFFYALYDDRTGIVQYSNGGAFPPIVIRSDGEISKLQRGGTLIGMDPDSKFTNGVLKLRGGDMLVAYTDGFIDQENSTGEYFGENRLIAFLKANRALELGLLMSKLFDTVLSFGDGTVKDDMTVIILRVK